MTDYAKMSKDELLAANEELMKKRGEAQAEIEAEQIALNAALDQEIAKERIMSNIEDMPQAERDLMASVLASAPPPKSGDEEEAPGVVVEDVSDNG